MYNDIKEFIRSYVLLPDDSSYDVMALWVIHTWAFFASHTTPYIYVNSPEKQSGKTRLIEVVELLVRNPIRATNISSAVLFRAIESMQPTVLLDEIDSVWHGSKNEELRGVLNGGYKTGGHVWRLVKGEPAKFDTFSPKLLAGINNGWLPDTVADRSIAIRLERKSTKEKVAQFYSADAEREAEPIVEKIEQWVADNRHTLEQVRPKQLEGISDRQWEISQPLVAIGKQLKVKGYREAIKEALSHRIVSNVISPREQLLRDIRELYEASKRKRMHSRDIVEFLGDAWSQKLLANRLAPFDIHPSTIRIKNQVAKGYYRTDFEDVWDRVL